MVDVIGKAKVIITGDVDAASIDKAGGKIGSSLKTGALIGAAALGTVAAAGFKAFQSFEQAEAQSRKLTQVLDNMGKTDAAPAVEKLADELSRLTGVDDDLIKQGQTLLATFSNIAESAGETGGVFERATKAAVDLAATGFGSVESSSIQLGKALQDPVKGITALGRAGVTFTEEQKKLIERFVEANDVASAQALILKEVEKQVGGTAEATATETEKIRTAWGEVEENVGALVADLVAALTGEGEGEKKSLSGSIRDVSDEIDRFSKSKSWKQLQGQIRTTAELIGKIVGPAEKVAGAWDKLTKKSPELATAIKLVVDPLEKVEQGLRAIADAYEAVRDFFDSGGPNFSSGARDLTPEDFGLAGGGPARGLQLVGENGPELAQFGGSGGYVYNNSQTRDILGDIAQGSTFELTQVFNGPNSLAEARREADWARTYGTRFGSATSAGAL